MSKKKDNGNGKGNLGTRLNLDSRVLRAENPPKNLVPRITHSLGWIRVKKIRGRIYYYWVKTEYRRNLSPLQVIVMYIGTVLPPGVKLGPVDEKIAKKLMEGK